MKRLVVILFTLSCATAAAYSQTLNSEMEKAALGLQSKNKQEVSESVKYIVEHANEVRSEFMFIASLRAVQLGDLENSGYLYYAAQMRARYDLQRYPPVGKGGNSPGVAIGAIKHQVGAVVNPRVFRNPVIYSKIVSRLDNWSVKFSKEYQPGWEYKIEPGNMSNIRAWEKKLLEKVKSEQMSFANNFSKLLNNKEYFASFKIVQDYNFGSKEYLGNPKNIKKKDNAINVMKRVEQKLKINGLYYKG